MVKRTYTEVTPEGEVVWVRCVYCRQPLRDEDSRARGVGPDCLANRGPMSPEVRASALAWDRDQEAKGEGVRRDLERPDPLTGETEEEWRRRRVVGDQARARFRAAMGFDQEKPADPQASEHRVEPGVLYDGMYLRAHGRGFWLNETAWTSGDSVRCPECRVELNEEW